MNGILVINKPAGITSHDVVSRVRRILGGRRVGHTGTLDPIATGVLVVCIGQATRIVEYLTPDKKEYVAGITFGVETDSQDSTGAVTRETDAARLSRNDVESALNAFRGRIQQIPPMVSAIHHEGQRLHDLARKGIEVERNPREVEIFRLDLTNFESGAKPKAVLEVECSTGTYIRTLAADIGTALGVGAVMHSLKRTRVGSFTLTDSVSLEELESLALSGDFAKSIRTIAQALAEWPKVIVDDLQLRRIVHGQSISHAWTESGPHLLVDSQGEPVAIAEPRSDNELAPVKVFRSPE